MPGIPDRMRMLTCTPVAFGGGADFFARDSGLICKGFQSLGFPCKAVMPLPAHASDQQEDLIRTEASNLEDPQWWRSTGADMVILYAWGRPRFARVAAAIRRSGAFLVLNQDNGGLISPLAGTIPWLREQWILGGQGRNFPSLMRSIQLAGRGLTIGLAITDPLRAEHLSHGHLIACVSPAAAEAYRRICRIYGGQDLASRVGMVPHPVETRFTYQNEGKLRQIVCVGRWRDELQKRPALLIAAMRELLGRDAEVTVVIAGETTDELRSWQQSLPTGAKQRVSLRGIVPRDELAGLMRESQVFYSPSAFESFGIAAAEALCSGCSVVAQRSVSMASFEWFVSSRSGRLTESDDAATHAKTLLAELDAWRHGERDATEISAIWRGRLHTDRIANRLLKLMRAGRDAFPFEIDS